MSGGYGWRLRPALARSLATGCASASERVWSWNYLTFLFDFSISNFDFIRTFFRPWVFSVFALSDLHIHSPVGLLHYYIWYVPFRSSVRSSVCSVSCVPFRPPPLRLTVALFRFAYVPFRRCFFVRPFV